MKTQHTTGPWKVSTEGIHVTHDCGRDGIKTLITQPMPISIFDEQRLSIEEMEANANLIAAAPEMLEALELFKQYEGCKDIHGFNMLSEAHKKASLAIKKAKGG